MSGRSGKRLGKQRSRVRLVSGPFGKSADKRGRTREAFMKDNKEYSKKVRKLYRSLKRKYPRVEKVVYDEPTEALVYAILSERMSEPAARAAAKRFDDYFVGLNDIRVSRPEEIIEALGAETRVARDAALVLLRVLGAIFTKYNTASLEVLKNVSKRQAKQVLVKLDGTSRFAVN